jgi:hypothetical protein
MSFGFESAFKGIRDEIDLCLRQGIMMFASASNESEKRRTYPADHPGVFCVYSANCNGKPSESMPVPETGDNFSFVGREIRPVWQVKGKELDYQSGTSFAVPVAVTIAIFIIRYIEKKWPDREWQVAPSTREGLAKIFGLMSLDKAGGYRWVSPVAFLNREEEEQIGDLTEQLRKVVLD